MEWWNPHGIWPFHVEYRWKEITQMGEISPKHIPCGMGRIHVEFIWNDMDSTWIPHGIRGQSKDLHGRHVWNIETACLNIPMCYLHPKTAMKAKTPMPQTHTSPSPCQGMWANVNLPTLQPQVHDSHMWIPQNHNADFMGSIWFHNKDRCLMRSIAGSQQGWYPPPSTTCATDQRCVPSSDDAYHLTTMHTAHPQHIPSSSDMHSQSATCTTHSQPQCK